MLGADVMVLPADHATQPREIALGLIGAGAVEAISLAVIDPMCLEVGVKRIPMTGFVGVYLGPRVHALFDKRDAFALVAHDE